MLLYFSLIEDCHDLYKLYRKEGLRRILCITPTPLSTPCLYLTLSQTANFRLLQIERACDDNFKVDENGRKFSKWIENTVGKR